MASRNGSLSGHRLQSQAQDALANLFLREGIDVRFIHGSGGQLVEIVASPTESDPNYVTIAKSFKEAYRVLHVIREFHKLPKLDPSQKIMDAACRVQEEGRAAR